MKLDYFYLYFGVFLYAVYLKNIEGEDACLANVKQVGG